MINLKILNYKDMLIKTQAEVVNDVFSSSTQTIIDTLIKASNRAGGYGLAAPQLGINKQIFIYRKNINSIKYKVIINPSILFKSGNTTSKNEGCLSVPGITKTIKRFRKFALNYIDKNGKKKKINSNNKLEVIILQHEFDHLMGMTILDR